MTGNAYSLQREMVVALLNRKIGSPPMKRITRGGTEIHSLLHHQLDSLQEVILPRVQDDNGDFVNMAGWDGPQE